MIFIGLFIGLIVGINIGTWARFHKIETTYKILSDGLKRDERYWFESYMQLLKWYNELMIMYVKASFK